MLNLDGLTCASAIDFLSNSSPAASVVIIDVDNYLWTGR
jgi:hypothetical protein